MTYLVRYELIGSIEVEAESVDEALDIVDNLSEIEVVDGQYNLFATDATPLYE